LPERHRILIVDDEPEGRRAVVQALRREAAEIDGIEADVLELDTIAGAREALRGEEFACVFLDHSLPDGTSLDLLMELRERGLTTPVVVLTGLRDEQAVAEVMRAGAVDYLPKERLHTGLVARSLRAALLFLRTQREKEAALAELHKFQFIADRAADTLFLMDADGHFVYVNQAACRSLGYTADQFRGLRVPDVDPLHQDAQYQMLFQRAQGESIPTFETTHRRADGTAFPVEVSVTRLDVGGRSLLLASGRDISERARVEEALRQSEARYRTVFEALAEGVMVQDATGLWQEANASAERILALSRDQMAGRTSADIGWRTVHEDGSLLPGEEHPPMVALRTGQAVRDMLMGIHRPDGTFAWLSANAELIPDPETGEPTGVVTSFFDITAQREAQRQLQARAEREALLNRINGVIRVTKDPERIRETAAAFVGEALGADRCFYVTYDPTRGNAQVSKDWHRADLPSIAGGYRATDFGPLLGELFREPRAAVVADVRDAFSAAVASVFEAFRHRAVLAIPFFDGGVLVAALYVSMADAPRAWTGGEVALVEQVATLTRTSLEAALVQEREHRIATDLQDALQPPLPEHIPGLSVGKFTRPALDEAQVGGDFYDIFPLDKEMYAIVIGDVSGKGLAAAQQLALIRNSLRTTLYLYRAPAQAAATLNGIVTGHDLLVGFVTAWVGVYDVGTGQISYCSCGHEPGLVRRANGTVEVLKTAGPPLGVAENAKYSESSVTLSSGDCLLLYTDGISESGPNRRELLGVEGLTRLLGALSQGEDAQAETEALVAEVSAYTSGVFRDDVAVILARRQ